MIIVDSREPKVLKEAFPSDIVEIKTLHTAGDFAIVFNGEVKCVIERKTLKDLSGSIITGRFHDQLERLKTYRESHPTCKIYYLIEGRMLTTKSRTSKGLSARGLICAEDRLMYKHDMYVIRTSDMQSTIDRILCMHKTLTIHFEKEAKKITTVDENSASESPENSDTEDLEPHTITSGPCFKVSESDLEIALLAMGKTLDSCGKDDISDEEEKEEEKEKEEKKESKVSGGSLDALCVVPPINDKNTLLKMWLSVTGITDRTYLVYAENISLSKFFTMASNKSLKEIKETVNVWCKDAGITIKPTIITRSVNSIKSKKGQLAIIAQIKGITIASAEKILATCPFNSLDVEKIKELPWKRKLSNVNQVMLINQKW